MFSNYDYNKPGPSRQSYYNDASSFYDYPPRSRPSNPAPSTSERHPGNFRGARHGYNLNYQNQNVSNNNTYPQNQWTHAQHHQKKQSYSQHHFKDKKREHSDPKDGDNRTSNAQKQQYQSKGCKKTNSAGDVHKRSSKIVPKEIDHRLYKCPNCTLQFDWSSRYNSYVGRVPLILNCKHTVCQECIHKLGKDGSIPCPICKNPSGIPAKVTLEDLQDIFSPNFFLIGFIMWSKTQGNNPNYMSLVPLQTNSTTKKHPGSSPPSLMPLPSKEICCFLSCNKPAILHCENCSDVYCSDCCVAVHKSAKSLWSHKQTPIETERKTLELAKCTEHNMDNEFFCTNCKSEVCCYCFLEQHESHGKENLTRLSDQEMEELQANRQNAKKLLKQLLISQRRLADIYGSSTNNIEKKISNYFINLHAKLQFIEKKLRKEMSNYSMERKVLPDMDDLNSKLATSIESLTNLVGSCEALEHKKLNLKEMSIRLRAVQDIPCYLLSENSPNNQLEPLEFIVDPVADDLESYFKIGKSDCFDFRLVSEQDLPSDYEKDSIDKQYESDAESCMSSISKSVASVESKKKKIVPTRGNQISLENEMVEVTHIESLECFYVQLKRMQYQFSHLNRDINDYIKMGAAPVLVPELNELYLAIYETKNDKIWCRARLTEIKNGETEPLYEVFFIDYGSTQTVDRSKLRHITSLQAQRKPFAIQCELYNPSMATWGKNAHVYMAKMLNGKQVTMMVKRVHSGVHEVDLMILSSDRGQTSIIDILIHTCNNALNTSSDNDTESVSSQKLSYNPSYKIFGNSTVFHKLQQERVIIVNVIDPHHIFVHLVAHAESLKKMNALLRSTYKNSQKNSCLPLEGTYVIVDYRDPIRGNWHRGLVKKVNLLEEKCHVLLIDWGLNVTVPWGSIRMIREEFTRLESQAILVKLAQIEPIDKGAWLNAATVFLQKYFRSQENMRMIVHNTDPLEVALFEMVGDVDLCINASLVLENFAESTGKISQTLEWSRNDAEVDGFAEEDGLVASLLKKVDEAMEDESEEEDDQDVVKQKIEIVKFVSPELIHIKFSQYEQQEMSLIKELQIHYSKERITKESWELDEPCVVLYELSYARAKIMEKISERKYKVNVYDRAAEIVLPVEKIFEYAKYFSKFQNVVFKSYLANIRPAGGQKWSLSSIEVLEKMFEKYKDIYGTRVSGDSTGKSMPMQMWYAQVKVGGALEASKTKFISLNGLLVKLGFAYRNATSKAGSVKSVKSNKSSRSKSSDSSNSRTSSPFTSVLEKIASKSSSTAVESGTDQDLKDFESSVSESKDDAVSESSVEDSKGCDSIDKPLDWNELVEEEKNAEKVKDEKDSPYRTHEAEIVDWIPAFPIKERDFQAWITCAENGGILYLREEKLQKVYRDMEKNIKEYFDKNTPTASKHNWQPGQLCTIHYNDYYYRGKVHKVNGPDDITVVMIDFGSDHIVTEKDLNREILYPKIPAFASKIKLDRVYPKSGAWLDSDYEILLDAVTEFGRIVIKGPLDDEIPTAEVFTNKGLSVNQTIAQMSPNLTRCLPTQQAESEDDGVVIEEEAIIEDDEELIVEVEHAEVDDVKDDSPVDTTKFEYKLLHLPDKGPDEKLPVSIMAVLEYNKVAIKDSETITEEFFQLGDKIQMCVESQPVIEHLELGMPCVCPFSEDGTWYRAQIYSLVGLDCGYVFAFFVDFGNVESVAVSDVKMMRPEWFSFPVSCHIADVNIVIRSDKHAQFVTQFMKKLYGKNKFAKIISKEPLCVSLHESNGDLCYESLLSKELVTLK